MQSMVSTHVVLGIKSGGFISLLEPPPELQSVAVECRNVGVWPVLVGEQGERDTLLASPIILYDYPQIAPESSGDLFDGTEIDEILSLRIMTLTEEEKREVRASDERARQILERTENMPAEQFMKLHGVVRGMRPLKGDAS
jgi:hydrogenase maturation protease